MNYDKLSRSLRYYYEKGIMQKVAGESFTSVVLITWLHSEIHFLLCRPFKGEENVTTLNYSYLSCKKAMLSIANKLIFLKRQAM